IILYTLYLLSWSGCHINVECSVMFMLLKYISKYINKPHCSTLEGQVWDEIQDHIFFLAAPEGVWKIASFRASCPDPSVVHL
ncbi:hypothetical protein BV20DRAFT_939336, partial [Pilatotrama ljubarskyi]